MPRTVWSCVSGFSALLVAMRQRDVDALLEQRRDDHHDDEQHQHDVDERRDVDVGLDAAAAAQLHCHSDNSKSIRDCDW